MRKKVSTNEAGLGGRPTSAFPLHLPTSPLAPAARIYPPTEAPSQTTDNNLQRDQRPNKAKMVEETQQIPACQRCRLRKIRCDHAAPKCSACSKSALACIIVDPTTQKQYTREYISDLERKEAQLEAKFKEPTISPRETAGANALQRTRECPSPINAHSLESTTTLSGYVGENSGLR